jgi:hypothetical protein
MGKSSDFRLVASLILFFVGGFLVALEVFTGLALLHGGRSLVQQVLGLHRFVALSAAALAIAAWLTPLDRLRWLGRTILIGGALGAFQALTVYLTVPERWDLTWQIGIPNALLVLALGAWLSRLANRRRAAIVAGVEVRVRRPGEP